MLNLTVVWSLLSIGLPALTLHTRFWAPFRIKPKVAFSPCLFNDWFGLWDKSFNLTILSLWHNLYMNLSTQYVGSYSNPLCNTLFGCFPGPPHQNYLQCFGMEADSIFWKIVSIFHGIAKAFFRPGISTHSNSVEDLKLSSFLVYGLLYPP